MSRGTPARISLPQARQLALRGQGLSSLQRADSLTALKRLGYVQIDTISVVERAHHHVLWSRSKDYRPSELGELLRRREVFEYWHHAASYLPIEDYRYCLPRMKAYAAGRSHWFRSHRKDQERVLARIRDEGPLMAKDFEGPRRSSGWFDWKPAKRALEQLFMAGSLMVSERRAFQKVYDLPERVLPPAIDRSLPDNGELARHLIQKTLRAHGLAREAEIRYLRSGLQKALRHELAKALKDGVLAPVRVEGLEKLEFFAFARELEPLMKPGSAGDSAPAELHILSPFDPLVIQRKRTLALFDFDYQIECYTPVSRREYGYFCLPVLECGRQGPRFIGRMDVKADRPGKLLRVLSYHPEPGARDSGDWRKRLEPRLRDFAQFNACERVVLPAKSTRQRIRERSAGPAACQGSS